MVPRNDKDLVPVPPERVRRLREHLINELRDLRKAAHLERFASRCNRSPRPRRPRGTHRRLTL